MGRKRKGCGECEGCQVVEDCGQCRFCRDKAKFGGPNRLKQVCVYKRCVLAEMEPEDSKKRRKVKHCFDMPLKCLYSMSQILIRFYSVCTLCSRACIFYMFCRKKLTCMLNCKTMS